MIKPPPFLNATGKKLFQQLATDKTQEQILIMVCAGYSLFVEASEEINKNGCLVKSAAGTLKHNPALAAQRQGYDMVIKGIPLLTTEDTAGQLDPKVMEFLKGIKK